MAAPLQLSLAKATVAVPAEVSMLRDLYASEKNSFKKRAIAKKLSSMGYSPA